MSPAAYYVRQRDTGSRANYGDVVGSGTLYTLEGDRIDQAVDRKSEPGLQAPLIDPIDIIAGGLAGALRSPFRAIPRSGPLLEDAIAPKLSNAPIFTGESTGVAFDAVKLSKIQASLEKQGVGFVTGEEGGRLAKALGGEAIYYPEVGRPGFIAWGKDPSRAAVVEELLHLGQHRASGWGNLSEKIVDLELQAQDRLLATGARLGWTEAELSQILRAKAAWAQKKGGQ